MNGRCESPLQDDNRLAALAVRQHGVVASRQLVQLGYSIRAIEHRLASGRLHRIHRGVYAVGYRRLTARGVWMAAVLAGPPGTLLSHRSAGACLDLAPDWSGVEVTVPGPGRRHRKGVVVHSSRNLVGEDRAICDGIPVTSVARTLLDLAEIGDTWRLGRALEEAERLGLYDGRAVNRLRDRSRGRRGLRVLDAALADVRPVRWTRSELERRFLDLCRAGGLRLPAVNVDVGGDQVDALWADARLVVELDGYESHRTRAAFERDRRRDARLAVAGHMVVRVTDRRIDREPAEVLAELRLLGAPEAE